MPALPSVSKVLDISYNFDYSEDPMAKCRQFFQYTGGPATSADLATLASSIQSSYGTNLKSLAHQNVSLTSVTITDLSSPTAARGEWSGSIVGTKTGHSLPASAATLQSLHISRRYRGGHPRTYWPFGESEDLTDDQKWQSSYVTGVTTALTDHFNDWSTDLPPSVSTVSPVNVSYYNGFTVHDGTTGRARNVSTPRSSPIVDAIIGFAVQQGLAQVRKRLLRLA